MTYEEFKASLKSAAPPEELSRVQSGLWQIAKGDWEAAHNIAQGQEGERDFDHLHAYLHRIEGDEWNANYWYRRAGVKMPDATIEEELDQLMRLFTSEA